MDFASPLLELVKELWGLASKPLGLIYNLKGNVDSLISATDSLKAVRNDVKARVEREEEGGGARRTNQVVNWLGKAVWGRPPLMKMINEKLLHTNHGFEVVIWVVVSKQVNKDSIRDAIRKRLNIKDKSWGEWSREERVHHPLEVLTQKKFVLLIDDLWARLDLSKIGVPRPGLKNRSKVVFTTRLKQVCHQMRADEIFEVLYVRRSPGIV
ncbi:hypothetical protein NL676_026374 [Syzygium grande]|nr:hypothetical protein NL676_026374 [Syzygium grande]